MVNIDIVIPLNWINKFVHDISFWVLITDEFDTKTGRSQARLQGKDLRQKQVLWRVKVGQKTRILYKDDIFAWWVDLGATSHLCKDLKWFEDFEPVEDESVHRIENIRLVFISQRLVNVILCLICTMDSKEPFVCDCVKQCWFKHVIESDKFLLT